MGSAEPSQSGVDKHKGTAAGGRPGPAPSRGGGVRASEGTNPCTRPSFATKNVFDVLQDLSESIGGSPGPQLDAADGQPEPIVHDLHQSLVELLERPEILSLHAVRRVGRERQLHLKVRALCGEVEKVFDVLVDTGAQVSLVKAGLLPPECLTDSRKPVRLKVANGQYMVGGTKEAAIGLQFVNHRELSRPDLGKEILLHGSFYEAEMDWDMIVGYDFMMETDSGVLPAQASMTLYQDDQLSWLSSPEHHVECQWIHPERNQLEVAALDTEPTGPANQEYGVRPEVASRVVEDLGASDLALDAFSSGTSAHLRVCEKYWSAQDSAWKKHWGPHQGLMWIHCPRWDIPRAIAKIRKDRSKAVLVVPMGCTEDVQMTSSSPSRQRRHAKKSMKQHREPKQLLFATYSRITPTMIQDQNQEKAALDAANPANLTTLVAQRQMRAHVKYMKHLIQTILLPTHRQAKAVISECPRTTPTMIQVQDQEKAALNAAIQGNLTTLVAQRQVRTHVKYMKHLIQTTLLPAVISECQAFNQAVNPLQAQTLPHFLIYPALLNGLA